MVDIKTRRQLEKLASKIVDAHDKLRKFDIDFADELDVADIRNDVADAFDIVFGILKTSPALEGENHEH